MEEHKLEELAYRDKPHLQVLLDSQERELCILELALEELQSRLEDKPLEPELQEILVPERNLLQAFLHEWFEA